MDQNFVTTIYSTTTLDEPDYSKSTGLAVSGGGSRSLSCAMGQYRALRQLGVLDEVAIVSSVSGGTWASACFMFLPAEFSDDDFLGPVRDPQSLTVGILGDMPPNNLGIAPTRMDWPSVIKVLIDLKTRDYPSDLLWQGLIGERIFQLWNLWKVGSDGLPIHYYSLDATTVSGTITPNNPQLQPQNFTLVQRKRPLLVMNTSVFSDYKVPGTPLLPFESSALGAGVRQTFVNAGGSGLTIGGGLIQPFAMASASVLNVSGDLATVTAPAHPFSIVDMAGASSAAFAQTVQKKVALFDDIIPRYPYWPVAEPQDAALTWFADGGSLENTGICALLARGVGRIIAFINTQTPLTVDASGNVTIDSSVQLLFGRTPDAPSRLMTEEHVASAPNATADNNQVFPTSAYDDLAAGLATANITNGGPAMFRQTVPVLANMQFHVAGGYELDILWVYNTNVPNWRNLLRPQVAQYVDTLANFPNYLTIEQLGLSAEEVNALAELSYWNLASNEDVVTSMFG